MENNRTALLVLDMQEAMLSRLQNSEELINNAAKAIDFARNKNIPVIYAVVGFRKGFPEVSPKNKNFAKIPDQLSNVPQEVFMKINDRLAPKNDEPVVNKKRFSAFAGSDLDIILRSQDIKHLVLSGISTSGVILSTAVEAMDKDFQMTILSDACADPTPEVHDFLMDKILPRYAEISTVDGWIK